MATRTLRAKYEAHAGPVSLVRSIYCSVTCTKEIYYQFDDEPEVTSLEKTASVPAETLQRCLHLRQLRSQSQSRLLSGGARVIPDEPIKVIDTFA